MKTFVIQAIPADTKAKLLEKPGQLLRLCPYDDILDNYCEGPNYLSCIQLHPRVYNHPSLIGHGWILVDGRCCLVKNRLSAFPNNAKHLVVDIDGFSSSSNGESDESECFSSDNMFLE